jgi:hypothetical protein
MAKAAHSRIGDFGVGVCPCHVPPVPYVTFYVTGCSSVKTNSLITTIITTIGAATCGHPTVALTGAPSKVNMCNQPVHRIGDAGANCGPYISVTGSGDTYSG